MKKMMLSALIFIAGVTNGAIFELPLECEGEYGLGDTWTTTFDLGVGFTEISNVYIDWAGELTAFQGMPVPIASQFVASLYESDPQDYFSRAYVAGGVATYPNPKPFDLQSVFTDDDWTLLLDGQSSIEIWFGDTPHPTGSGGAAGTGSLNSATLVIEGTVVPEPITLALFGFGFLFIRKRN